MAYTYADVYRMSRIGTSRTIEEQDQMIIINKAQILVWRSANWRWTTAKLNPFWLEPNIQDYGPPIVAVPVDFERLLKAYVLRLTTPSPIVNPLEIRSELNQENTSGVPKQISFLTTERSFRLWPRSSGGMGSPNYLVNATYKKIPTRILTSTYQTTDLPTPDHQINMWLAAMDWAYAAHTKDPNAGKTQFLPNGTFVATGKLADALTEIQLESRNEGLDQGSNQVAPTESLDTPGIPNPWFW